MDPRRGKATRTASKAGTATPRVLAQGVKGPRADPSEHPAALGAAKCGPVGASGSRRKKSAPSSPERPQVRARTTRAKKAPLGAEDLVEGLAVPAEKMAPPAAPGPPLPRTGSRRERGARAAREQRALPEPTEVSGLGPPVPASSLRRRGAAPGAWKPRAVLEKLRLRRQEISVAAEVVNRVVDHLLRRLQSCESEFKGVSLLRTGSYYEHVKISAPNEFDIMFKLEVPRIQLEEYCNSGAYYFVKFKRNPKGNPLSQFLEDEILSASKMLLKFRKIIKEEIKNIQDTDVIMEKKKRGSPAVTLLIRKPKEISVDIILALESKSSWPASTQEGLPISQWLGTKVKTNLRRQPFYLVPKHAKEGNGFQEETWRLSFSHIEKDLLKSHGHSKTCCETDGVKCCRKDCLKLMKYLLEQLKTKFGPRKELDKFCSYHVKTAFFHVCTQDPQDSHWHTRDLELCFDNCVTYFLECLKEEQLQHYFIPGFNLFSRDQIDKISKEFLSQLIEYERNNGFPVFHEF
ncbi:cyclic GMP-AMP synthase [Ailuropoda melanoleuca]|uniref:Cyclic GMP-AMP synthase n=1 Tax=Ailuropoda melanoleuca TaxID=9646 RepID=A0A7N5P7A8_AILME|nr:cyclic GMP-AMP synthase [Ailuropoda melanoleuca]